MKKLLVAYISIIGVRSEDVENFMYRIANNMLPEGFEGELIYMPINSPDSRIECIDPIYITNEKLIIQHESLMKKLNENLKKQLDSYEED